MVLCGKINKDLTAKMNNLGVRAIGICGKDANLIEVSKMETGDGYDLGLWEPLKILTQSFLGNTYFRRVYPRYRAHWHRRGGQSFNINADTAAAEIAVALKAEKLILSYRYRWNLLKRK